jgi:DNA-binding Lrp family transcriptional regulator
VWPRHLDVPGLGEEQLRLYRSLLARPTLSVAEVPALLGCSPGEAQAHLDELEAAGLVVTRDGILVASAPGRALGRLIEAESRRLDGARGRLDALQQLLPAIEAQHRLAREVTGEPVAIEAISTRDVVPVIQMLTTDSEGDLLWMRPDQWRLPEGHAADRWVQDLLRAGRRSRVLYPARVLEEAPDVVRRLFEAMWKRALAVPGIDALDADEQSDRLLLLDQLADGLKDEQIARNLGLSLRTVRRRVADLMADLDAGSRFQAGVEAARRGWLD